MNLRPARFVDVLTLLDMLIEKHQVSIYAPCVEVDRDYTRKLLAGMVQRHGGAHNGGTCVFVAEDREGVIQGFVAGVLVPVYQIGNRLMAQDVFLIARDRAPYATGLTLMRAYIEWAETNPKVLEIWLSHTDVIPGSERIASQYERLGFGPAGAMFRRMVNLPSEEQVAA